MTFLEQLRKKPKAVRQKIVWVVTGALSLLIFVMWFNVWSADSAGEGRREARAAGKEISPVDALGNIWKTGKETRSASLGDLNAIAEESKEKEKDQGDVVYPEEVFGERNVATTSEQ